MDAAVVVVVDVTVDRLNHFTRRLKSVEIAQLVFEAPVERLDKAILPGRRHVADGDLDIPLVKIIGTALRHELSALVGMKDQRRHTGCESLVQGRQNQMTIVALADTFGQDLACDKIFDGREMPDRTPILDAAQVATPHPVRIGDRQIDQQIAIAVMGCGNGAVSFDSSSRWAEVELRHHPLGPFVIDAQVDCNAAMAVSRMLTMHRFNLLFECVVFGWLLQLAVDILATDV